MKLNEMIVKAMAHDAESADAEQIIRAAKAHTPGKAHRPRLRAAAVIAAAFCLLTVTLYASGVLSGFGTAFTVPLESGDVRVLTQETDNTDVVWSITEVWFDSYNLHIGGTVTLPIIPQENKTYKAAGQFRAGSPEETYYLDGTLYPNGTKTVPFVMSAPTVTDGEGGARRPGWEEDEITLDLTFESIFTEPENTEGQWDIADYTVCPGAWHFSVAFVQAEHRDTVTLTGPFSGTSADASAETATAERVKLSPFTLEIDGENLMRFNNTRYNIWIRMTDGTYALKGRGVFRDESENRIAFDASTSDRIAISFYAPIDVSQAEAIIIADKHGFGGEGLADTAEEDFECHPIADPDALNVITDIDGEVWEMWKVLLEIPLN